MFIGKGDNAGTHKPVCNNDCTRCKPLCIAYSGGYSVYRYASEKNRAIGLRHILKTRDDIVYTYACPIKHNRGCK